MISRKDSSDVGILAEDNLIISRPNGNIYAIKRPIYSQYELECDHGCHINPKTWQRNVKSKVNRVKMKYCHKEEMKNCTVNKFPFAKMMMGYKWKQWLLADFIAGIVIGIIQIPQSMAYAHLAGLKAIYGLYVSFFPVILYFFFGTSRHISIGTTAIISLLTGKFLEKSLYDFPPPKNITEMGVIFNNISYIVNVTSISNNDELRAARTAGFAFLVGIVQIILRVLNLGFITRYLSDPLISGFYVGSSIHILTSQIKYCLGLIIPHQVGLFNIAKTYHFIFINITRTNIPTLILALLCIIVLIITEEVINPRLMKRFPFPVPIEMILIIIGTIVSKFVDLNEKYKVLCVGNIEKGLPMPTVPDLRITYYYIDDLLITALVGFSFGISLSKLHAKKHGYRINSNQEMLAYGIMNFVSSFFHCFPSAASIRQTTVKHDIGGKSQLTSVVSTIILILVILFVAPLFSTLPKCILSAIIIVALKRMFLKFVELKELWFFSLWDFGIWVITFLCTVFIDVDYGLILGIVFSFMVVVFRTQNPKTEILGRIKGTDIYTSIDVHTKCQQLDEIKIFRFEGSLYYACTEHFRNSLYSQLSCDPKKITLRIEKLERKLKLLNRKLNSDPENMRFNSKIILLQEAVNTLKNQSIRYIIIDCSSWSYIDFAGVKVLFQVIEEYKSIGIDVCLVNPKNDVRKTILFNESSSFSGDENIFVTIHDAVITCLGDSKPENTLSNTISEEFL